MPSLPTAHASQSYGRRQLEFFATTGHIAPPERRQKASERRFQDMDGGMHTVRLANSDAPMENGDSIAVLRAQSGPDRRSRAVSVINYRTNSWEPAAPEATRALSRAGITRGTNWWLSMIALALFAIVLVWPDLRTALVELNPSLFGALPAFNLVALAGEQAGFLIGADPAASIPGLGDVVAATGIFSAGDANGVLLGLGLALLGLIAYVGRTWRVVWIPVFLVAALASGLVLGGVAGAAGIALIAIGGLALFFCVAGLVNRVRDASRFRSRVSRLSEHMLRNPPQESVVSPPPSQPRRIDEAALATAAGPVAAAAVVDQAIAEAPEVDAAPTEDETVNEAERTHADPAEDAGEAVAAAEEAEGATADDEAETQTAASEDAPAAGDDTDDPDPETPEPVRTMPATAEVHDAPDATDARDARTSAAFGALAAAMSDNNEAEPDNTGPDDAGDDDLPSDADLALARGEEVSEPDAEPAADQAETNDRDMSLPEPPPLATPEPGSLASAPQAELTDTGSDQGGDTIGEITTDPASAETTIAATTMAPVTPVAVEDVTDESDAPGLTPDENDNDPMMARDEPSDPDEERQS